MSPNVQFDAAAVMEKWAFLKESPSTDTTSSFHFQPMDGKMTITVALCANLTIKYTILL